MSGEEAHLAVTFPDGTEALIAYPSHLELAQMGVQPDVSLEWRGDEVGSVVFRHGPPDDRLLTGAVAATHLANGMRVEEWPAAPRDGTHRLTRRWLVFRLPSWTVHVPLSDRMEVSSVLKHVQPFVDEGGYVLLEASGPAELARLSGEGGGPGLAFGDGEPLPDLVLPGPDGLFLELEPVKGWRCEGAPKVHGSYGSACLAGGQLTLQATVFPAEEDGRVRLREAVRAVHVLDYREAS